MKTRRKCDVSVALRKESVDRNCPEFLYMIGGVYVALRKESVDRNPGVCIARTNAQESLSARRAWIEIKIILLSRITRKSLSARRAWIEMPTRC